MALSDKYDFTPWKTVPGILMKMETRKVRRGVNIFYYYHVINSDLDVDNTYQHYVPILNLNISKILKMLYRFQLMKRYWDSEFTKRPTLEIIENTSALDSFLVVDL